jgi:hypothetical protein
MHSEQKQSHKEIFDATYHLERFRRNIELSKTFVGRTARTDKEVLKALTYISMQNGGYSVSPGERLISEISGKDKRTVSKALWRLHHRGWITNKWNAPSIDGKASIWRINWDAPFLVDVEFIDETEILSDLTLWSGYCLGQNAQTIFRAIYLNNQGLKKKQLQVTTGFGYKAVSTALKFLTEAQLIDKVGRQYYVHQFESIDQQKAQVEATKVSWNINERIEKKIERHRLDRIVVENLRKFSATYRQNRHSYFQLEQLKKQYERKSIPNATHTDKSKTK